MRRWLLRILILLVLVIFVAPYLIPLNPVGVEASTLADPDGFFITVDGLSTYVEARGPEDGDPVILLHGWGASTFTWRNQMDVLAEAGYRAIAFDRPPYGLSAKTGENIPYSPAKLAEFTVEVMDTLGIQQAALVGQSQGGGVVGYFAVKYPGRVSKIVFVSAALRPTDDPEPTQSGGSNRVGGALGLPPFVSTVLKIDPLARWARIGIRAFVTPSFVTNILESAYYDPAFMTLEIEEGYQRQLEVVGWDEALLNQVTGMAFQNDPITAAQISAIDVPVMIAWGENDTWVPISVGERLHELLPDAEWHTYAECGHLPQEEAAEKFNANLLAFLAKEN